MNKETKMSPNDAILQLIRYTNAGKLEEFYKTIELYADGFVASSQVRHDILRLLKQKPLKMVPIKELQALKGLVNELELFDENVFLSEGLSELFDELILEWQNADTYKYHNVGVRRKLLLHGPTGNGKTSIAKWIARKAELPFIEVNSEKVVESHLGATGANISKIFTQINQPSVLFWDEIDSVGKERNSRDNSGIEAENNRISNALLVYLEKLNENIVFIGATNRKDSMDSAFVRRFDELIEIKTPCLSAKENFLSFLSNMHKIPLDEINIDASHFSSFSDLKNEFKKQVRRLIAKKINIYGQ